MIASSHSAIVLFAHGSRDPLWHQPMEAVAAQITSRSPHTPVACAYLELSAPDLPTVVSDLVQQGAVSIVIVPMFLGVGRHAREDLPTLVRDLRLAHNNVEFKLLQVVGEDARLINVLADIALENI